MADARVLAAAELARDVLAPVAEQVDERGVPRSHIDALAASGLLALHVPDEYGDLAPAAVVREIGELLAAADASTWFVWTQHKTCVQSLLTSDNAALREQWLPKLTQTSLGAVAFSHLRRRVGQVTAREVDSGWQLDGYISWLTGWGLAEVALVSADAGDRGYVHLLIEAIDQSGLSVPPPARLAAMNGTHTVAVQLDGVVVPADRLVSVTDPEAWHSADRQATADTSPAVFGVARGALAGLDASPLTAELERVRAHAYAAADAGAPWEDRLVIRAEALDLCLRAAAAGVAAVGGRAVSLDHPAQRRVREAMFLLVQAQTAELRSATLRRLAR